MSDALRMTGAAPKSSPGLTVMGAERPAFRGGREQSIACNAGANRVTSLAGEPQRELLKRARHRLSAATVCALCLVAVVVATRADSPTKLGGKASADYAPVTGNKNITAAWFSDPTDRYRHFVLGARSEPETLEATSGGKHYRLTLGPESVFEDRRPRLADINGDGEDEIVVVRSYISGGAALAVFQVRPDGLSLLAETPDMGHPFGWLNPAGIADYDGDGKTEIAFVRKPHVLGRLELWRYTDAQLVRVHSVDGASNHPIGSEHTDLSATRDVDGDGVPDLIVPSFDRRFIRALSFTPTVRELSRLALPSAVVGSFQQHDDGTITALLESGQTARLRVGRARALELVP